MKSNIAYWKWLKGFIFFILAYVFYHFIKNLDIQSTHRLYISVSPFIIFIGHWSITLLIFFIFLISPKWFALRHGPIIVIGFLAWSISFGIIAYFFSNFVASILVPATILMIYSAHPLKKILWFIFGVAISFIFGITNHINLNEVYIQVLLTYSTIHILYQWRTDIEVLIWKRIKFGFLNNG